MDVQGRLRDRLSFWENVLKATSPVIECIRDGYKLPLFSIPVPFSGSNQKSALIIIKGNNHEIVASSNPISLVHVVFAKVCKDNRQMLLTKVLLRIFPHPLNDVFGCLPR